MITEKVQQNWFDIRHGRHLQRMSAEDALQLVATDPRVISAVEEALAEHDAGCHAGNWCGPSRAQMVRMAIADVLSKDEYEA